MTYKITTTPFADGKIVQEILDDSDSTIDGIRKQVLRQVMDTKERQTRQALIAIGWTPPRYLALWESINGAGSWANNPWVWALTFSVDRRNVDSVLSEVAP